MGFVQSMFQNLNILDVFWMNQVLIEQCSRKVVEWEEESMSH